MFFIIHLMCVPWYLGTFNLQSKNNFFSFSRDHIIIFLAVCVVCVVCVCVCVCHVRFMVVCHIRCMYVMCEGVMLLSSNASFLYPPLLSHERFLSLFLVLTFFRPTCKAALFHISQRTADTNQDQSTRTFAAQTWRRHGCCLASVLSLGRCFCTEH